MVLFEDDGVIDHAEIDGQLPKSAFQCIRAGNNKSEPGIMNYMVRTRQSLRSISGTVVVRRDGCDDVVVDFTVKDPKKR
jgi:hypothetical protein